MKRTIVIVIAIAIAIAIVIVIVRLQFYTCLDRALGRHFGQGSRAFIMWIFKGSNHILQSSSMKIHYTRKLNYLLKSMFRLTIKITSMLCTTAGLYWSSMDFPNNGPVMSKPVPCHESPWFSSQWDSNRESIWHCDCHNFIMIQTTVKPLI